MVFYISCKLEVVNLNYAYPRPAAGPPAPRGTSSPPAGPCRLVRVFSKMRLRWVSLPETSLLRHGPRHRRAGGGRGVHVGYLVSVHKTVSDSGHRHAAPDRAVDRGRGARPRLPRADRRGVSVVPSRNLIGASWTASSSCWGTVIEKEIGPMVDIRTAVSAAGRRRAVPDHAVDRGRGA
jgi:hypothetical protein